MDEMTEREILNQALDKLAATTDPERMQRLRDVVAKQIRLEPTDFLVMIGPDKEGKVRYGVPNHVPMNYWSDYTLLPEDYAPGKEI